MLPKSTLRRARRRDAARAPDESTRDALDLVIIYCHDEGFHGGPPATPGFYAHLWRSDDPVRYHVHGVMTRLADDPDSGGDLAYVCQRCRRHACVSCPRWTHATPSVETCGVCGVDKNAGDPAWHLDHCRYHLSDRERRLVETAYASGRYAGYADGYQCASAEMMEYATDPPPAPAWV